VAIAGAAVMGLFARNLFQLIPRSSLLRKMAAAPFPAHVEFYSIYSTGDWVCPPPSCKAVDSLGHEVGTNIELQGIGHNEFLMYKAPYKMIRKILFRIPEGASSMEDKSAMTAAGG
jgi:hypothetical protein